MTKSLTPEQRLAALLARPAAVPRLAASLLLVRDAGGALEVLMGVRAQGMDFAGGAMVFPGGKIAEGDRPAALGRQLLQAPDLSDDEIALRVSALRESYEEVGILPARTASGAAATDADVQCIDGLRADVDRGVVSFADALTAAQLHLDVMPLVSFAHLITPVLAPKRFDTWFYLLATPAGQTARADGTEIVETRWVTPAAALAQGVSGSALIILPTRLVLERLAGFANVAAAVAGAHAVPPGMVMPTPAVRDGVLGLESDAVAGFPATWEAMRDFSRMVPAVTAAE